MRRLMLALALPAVVLVSLAALVAANRWLLEDDAPIPVRVSDAPTPVGASDLVKEGEWSGHRWQLIAYRSRTHGLCFSVTPARWKAGGSGSATSCAPFVGGPRTAEIRGASEMTITILGGAAGPELPAYVACPVIDKASTVEIRFGTGRGSQAADLRRAGLARARPLLCGATADKHCHPHFHTRSTQPEPTQLHHHARRPRRRWECRCLPRPANGRGRLLTTLGLRLAGAFRHTGPRDTKRPA
jgi:hypothetical protein